MKASRPPALAIRLMEETGTDPAAVGDLVEAYTTGRGSGWFWRQAIAASAPSPINGLRWVAAIPLAVYTSRFMRIEINQLALAALHPTLHPWGFHGWRLFLPTCISEFLSSVSLVLIGSLMVPSRKRLVANCLFGFPCVMWALVGLLMILQPSRFDFWMIPIGTSSLLGGLIAVFSAKDLVIGAQS